MAPRRIVLLVLVLLVGVAVRDTFAGRLTLHLDGSPLRWTLKARVSATGVLPTLLDLDGRMRCHHDAGSRCPMGRRRGYARGTMFLTTTEAGDPNVSMIIYVPFTPGRCVFDGGTASGLGGYSCRNREGIIVGEAGFTFGKCRCRGGKACRLSSPCAYGGLGEGLISAD